MKIYLLLGHPDKESFNGQFAEMYHHAAIDKGHEVRFQRSGRYELRAHLVERL